MAQLQLWIDADHRGAVVTKLAELGLLLDQHRGDRLTITCENGWLYVTFRRHNFQIVIRGFPATLEESLDQMMARIRHLNEVAA